MKKNNFTLIIFLLLGLLAGSIVAGTLSSVNGIDFLTNSLDMTWEPAADFDFVKYSFSITVKVSLLSLLGAVGGYWLFRKI